ncbi:MAG: peptidase M16 [Rhizobiales bacterium 65-9]|nr:insulinase family protein [Hyphomicrobiales bacterium]OJY38105.1 MAG: peptidase M16 [Rhizobiales bacterium 65-9]
MTVSQTAPAGPVASHDRLANGLEVVVIPDHRTPVVTHMVWYRNGSADDPAGKSGIAHFLEHLMFKGTHKHPAGEFSAVVSDLGGQENAFTSMDYTAYFQRVAKEHLATMMAFEADRMANLALAEDVVGPERDVVIEERRMRTDNRPDAQLGEALTSSLFTHHPYGVPIIGWMHEIEGLGREDALAYYNRFYTPENAILVVAGDVTREEALRLANDTYGRIPARGAQPVRHRPQEPEPRARRLVRLADEKVEQPYLQRIYLAPSLLEDRAASDALDVAAQLLGAPQTGYLYRRLARDRGLAVASGAWYMGTAVDRTQFGVYAVPTESTDLAALERALDETLAEFTANGPTEAELARAKTRLIADHLYSQDSQANLARAYGATLAVGGAIADVQDWQARIEAVTADDVRAALARWLSPQRSATGYLETAAAA